MQTITPLRIALASFCRSKSQRRVMNKNTDLRHEVVPAVINDELRAMFQRHKERFTHNVPDALETFLGPDPAAGTRPASAPSGCCRSPACAGPA